MEVVFPELSASQWIGAAVAAALVGLSKAGFGAGAGILAVPLMAAVLGPANMLPVMLLVLILGDVFSIIHYPRDHDARNLAMLLPGLLVGVVGGALALDWFLNLPDAESWLRRLIGGLSVLFVGFQMYRLQRERRTGMGDRYVPRIWHGVGLGACAGLTSTLAHAGGPLIVLFLLPQKLDKRVFVGTVIKYFFVGNMAKLVAYQTQDLFRADRLTLSGALLPCVVVGTLVGVLLHRRFSDRVFRLVIYLLAFGVGLYLLSGWEPGVAAQPADGPEVRFHRATRAYREGRYREAAEAFGALRKDLPASRAVRLNAGLAHYRAGELAEAAGIFRELSSAKNPRVRLRAVYALGNCAYRGGDFVRALASYRETAAGCRQLLRRGVSGKEAEELAELMHRAEFNAHLARERLSSADSPEEGAHNSPRGEGQQVRGAEGAGEGAPGRGDGEERLQTEDADGAAGAGGPGRTFVQSILDRSRREDVGPVLGAGEPSQSGSGPPW